MNIKDIKNSFVSPGAEYRGKPFWSWNGELREEELIRQAEVMKEMGLGGFFMHSRSGLMTEYLGDTWFELTNKVADAAEKLGMEAWLYDEDRWPSGCAGGKVTVDPQYRMKSLVIYESDVERLTWNEESISLFVGKLDGINLYTYKEVDVSGITDTESAKAAAVDEIDKLSDSADARGVWKALRFAIVPESPNSRYNGTTYIDTMSRKATDKFIELTHGEYEKRCGDRLGKSIKGIFTDEPHRGACFDNLTEKDGVKSCNLCYTDDIFDELIKRYGLDVHPILPELFYRSGGEKVAPCKLHYIDLANLLFLERFAKPINDWCKAHNIIFTGHALHEDSLMCQTAPGGSIMRFYEYMGYPGIDCLNEHNYCYWIAKQLSSVTRQLGQKWLLSELYGCTGWQFNFKSHKAVGDWQALFGINLRCQHLSWYTMEGEAKRDYPASILHQSPWYKEYGKVEDYFARLGLVMSEGKEACDVLLLNPIESLWCQAYIGWSRWLYNQSADVAPYEKRYAELFHMLTDNQIDFDYGEEEMMSRYARVGESESGEPLLYVGNASYRTVIVSNMLTIRPSTLKLLDEFTDKGGSVIFAGDVPEYVNAVRSAEPKELSKKATSVAYDEKQLVDAVRKASRFYVNVTNGSGKTEKSVFAQVRRSFGDDGYAVVLLNIDRNKARNGLTVSLDIPSGYFIEEWDLENGKRYDASAVLCESSGKTEIKTDLTAAGTRCFVFTKIKDTSLLPVTAYKTVEEKTLCGEFNYTADEKNVCVLDWVRWRKKGEDWHGETEVLRADREIRTEFGIEWRGGNMLQPWYAKNMDKKIYSDIQLEYEFFFDILPKGEVFLAGERPELNAYKLNGVALSSTDINDFWIDECFKKMPVPSGALKLGRNVVTVDVSFMRTTNVEALYLVGDFGVTLDGKKRTLTESPAVIGNGNLSEYGLPFFTGNMTYHVTPEAYKEILGDSARGADRIALTPSGFTGACVKISALGKSEILAWDPYEADITEAYKEGAPIDVTIYGTRTNVFGPLHQIPKPAGACGPVSFVTSGQNWTDDYSLLQSGIRGITFKAQKKI